MKKIRNIFLLTSLLFVGCTADELLNSETGSLVGDDSITPLPLVIESASLDAEVVSTRATRPSDLCIFLDGWSISSAGIPSFDRYISYLYKNNRWEPESNLIFYIKETVQLCAYSPLMGLFWDYDDKEQIPLFSQIYDTTTDLSYVPNRPVNKGENVNLSFKHAYARLRIQFTKESSYSGEGKVSKVKLKHLLSSGTIDISRGVYSSTTGTENGGVESSGLVRIADGAGVKTPWNDDFLLIPCTPYAGSTSFIVTIDGEEYTVNIPESSYKPEAGKYKEITLRLNNKGIQKEEYEVLPWIDKVVNAEH